MAMTDEEQQEILSQVAGILREDIHGDLMDFYAAAVALTEKHPDQVNNEVRNAVAHLGRALVAESTVEAVGDIRQARSHISRAKRDAIKLAVIELHDRIQDACREIRDINGSIDLPFLVRRDELTRRRRQLLRSEINGAEDVVDGYVQMFNLSDELEFDLVQAYDLKEKRVPRWRRLVYKWWRAFVALVVGVVIGLIGAIIFAVLWPNAEDFGNGMRAYLGLPVSRPAATSQSGASKPPSPAASGR